MAARGCPLRLVIFDCDGVLVDSEAISSRVCAAAISALGWPITAADSQRLFLGMSLSDMRPIIEARTGCPVPVAWISALTDRLRDAMSREAVLVPGARAVLEATGALGLDWRIASNSGPEELAAKFARTGLTGLVAGRVHSAHEVIARGGRGKPAPDLFLAAARESGVAPAECVVVEDSATGVRGAIAAGMACLAYVPEGDGSALGALGAAPFRRLDMLAGLFGASLARAA